MSSSNSPWFAVGDIQVAPVSDGISRVPAQSFPKADWAEHADLLHADGTMHLPVGSFVVRTGGRTVLLDAGLGAMNLPEYAAVFDCGRLPAALAAVGVRPEDIDIVACSHLHLDHAGWLAAEGRLCFPNADVVFGAADWDQYIATEMADPLAPEYIRAGLRLAERAGRLRPIERDGQSIAPGVTARATPGHTRGHQTFILSSGAERLVVLGDAVVCPLQIARSDWDVIADTDPALAARTREALLRELEGSSARVVGPHFPGLRAGRVLPGQGRRHFLAG
ncbi:MAG: MBL fold metallo-hydrolase [Gammaproteobacteria bacterium]